MRPTFSAESKLNSRLRGGALRAARPRPQDFPMPGLPEANITDRRYSVLGHPPAVDALVPGGLSGRPGQDRPVVPGVDASARHQLPHGLARPAEVDAGDGRERSLLRAGLRRAGGPPTSASSGPTSWGATPRTKLLFVAAVSLNGDGHLVYVKMAPLPGFTRRPSPRGPKLTSAPAAWCFPAACRASPASLTPAASARALSIGYAWLKHLASQENF